MKPARRVLSLILLAALFASRVQAEDEPPLLPAVTAATETDTDTDWNDSGDACIWVHPTDPSLSAILIADEEEGLAVYDLDGRRLQQVEAGDTVGVDLRYNIPFDGRPIDLVAAGNRTGDCISLYRMNPIRRRLELVEEEALSVELDLTGACLYQSPSTSSLYVFAIGDEGEVEQWQLREEDPGRMRGRFVRAFALGSEARGCEADDELGVVYAGEQEKGIWKIGAEPEDDTPPECIAETGMELEESVDGLGLFLASNRAGYLIASDRKSGVFSVFERAGNNRYVTAFRVEDGTGIDGVEEPGGLAVSSFYLGPRFPMGLFATADGDNEDGADTNYKLVSWPDIAGLARPPLVTDISNNPRRTQITKEE